ncbi:hypothetical protein SS50377_25206 [Spironucleus salmonicida]|uniref:Uncharacterized protein n=1 Tax=Spironucleus salmonicida TaxID=348837 RepID=V6LQB4_9EUKA|nr:hypothetical protein SS50377_25206 [Spironucleus salmonicida]|eukprot:EST46862.1 Hypothetical protein SS50377_13130 [Spironucleus salmonicida]
MPDIPSTGGGTRPWLLPEVEDTRFRPLAYIQQYSSEAERRQHDKCIPACQAVVGTRKAPWLRNRRLPVTPQAISAASLCYFTVPHHAGDTCIDVKLVSGIWHHPDQKVYPVPTTSTQFSMPGTATSISFRSRVIRPHVSSYCSVEGDLRPGIPKRAPWASKHWHRAVLVPLTDAQLSRTCRTLPSCCSMSCRWRYCRANTASRPQARVVGQCSVAISAGDLHTAPKGRADPEVLYGVCKFQSYADSWVRSPPSIPRQGFGAGTEVLRSHFHLDVRSYCILFSCLANNPFQGYMSQGVKRWKRTRWRQHRAPRYLILRKVVCHSGQFYTNLKVYRCQLSALLHIKINYAFRSEERYNNAHINVITNQHYIKNISCMLQIKCGYQMRFHFQTFGNYCKLENVSQRMWKAIESCVHAK